MPTDEAILIARGIRSAVSNDGQITPVQASLLMEVIDAALDVRVDVGSLDPLDAESLAEVMAGQSEEARRREIGRASCRERVSYSV